jgi:Ras-related protein Rab-2A
MSYNYLFKYIIVGDSGSGKSCLLLRFTDNRFENYHDVTIGVEFGTKIINIDHTPIKIQVWDAAGQESFRSITRAYYRNSTVALLVFDITRRSTFKSVKTWLKDIQNETSDTVVIVLVGNKCDLDHRRQVKKEEAEALAKKHGLIYLESSAKTGENVEEIFTRPADIVYNRIKTGDMTIMEGTGIKLGLQPSSFSIYTGDENSSWNCCPIS